MRSEADESVQFLSIVNHRNLIHACLRNNGFLLAHTTMMSTSGKAESRWSNVFRNLPNPYKHTHLVSHGLSFPCSHPLAASVSPSIHQSIHLHTCFIDSQFFTYLWNQNVTYRQRHVIGSGRLLLLVVHKIINLSYYQRDFFSMTSFSVSPAQWRGVSPM